MHPTLRLAHRAVAAAALLAGIATPAIAQHAHGTTASSAAAAPGRQTLWTLSKGETTVYLLGSVHAMSADVYPLSPRLDSAFADAERVVFEVPIDSLTQRAGEMLPRATIAGGRTLKDLLSAETYGLAERTLPRLGVPLAQAQRFEPWFVGMLLTQITLQRAGLDARHGIDMHFNERAKRAGKPIAGLESVDFQLGLFDSMSPADQDLFLRETLAGIDTAAQVLVKMKEAWRAGDADGLARVTDSMARYPALRAMLLTDRNRRWVPQIEAMLSGTDDVLVVVGAGHLVGPESVVELLRKRGHTVTQR